jgi:hypothetical protein
VSTVPSKSHVALPTKQLFAGGSPGVLFRHISIFQLKQLPSAAPSVKNSESRSVSSSQGTSTTNLIQLIRKEPYHFIVLGLPKTITIFAGKYQESENDKAAEQEHSITISKIDKESFNRLTEESRRLKFEHEATLREFMVTKAQLVRIISFF